MLSSVDAASRKAPLSLARFIQDEVDRVVQANAFREEGRRRRREKAESRFKKVKKEGYGVTGLASFHHMNLAPYVVKKRER